MNRLRAEVTAGLLGTASHVQMREHPGLFSPDTRLTDEDYELSIPQPVAVSSLSQTQMNDSNFTSNPLTTHRP